MTTVGHVMTPAQKIAREVRRSFSVAASPLSSNQLDLQTEATVESDQSRPSSTPAQVVAQQARNLGPLSHDTPDHGVTKRCKSTRATPNVSPGSPHPTVASSLSFQVISGRKGLPDDGNEKDAVVRPLETDGKPQDPCLATRSSRLGLVTAGLSSPSESKPDCDYRHGSPSQRLSAVSPAPSPSPMVSNASTPILAVSPNPRPSFASACSTPPIRLPSSKDGWGETASTGLVDIQAAMGHIYNNVNKRGQEADDDEEEEEEEEEEETEEEEDYDSNPLYIVLSTSASPRLKNAYDSAKLVLLPARRALPIDLPRRLPDPSVQFESEWEQWIAAHTFVPLNDPSLHGSVGPRKLVNASRVGVDWVGLSQVHEGRVELRLEPGNGLAEVRVRTRELPPTPCPSMAVMPLPADPAKALFQLPKIGSEVDPHQTIRRKLTVRNPELHQLPKQPTGPSSLVLMQPEHHSHLASQTQTVSCSTCSSIITQSDLIRSPSTATESSLPCTQSSGVSRSSSDGWSDMPPTPPNMVSVLASQVKGAGCKSHLSTSLVSPVGDSILPPIGSSGQKPCRAALNPSPTINDIDSLGPTRTVVTKIISEETMYRSPPPAPVQPPPSSSSGYTGPLESALSGSKNKKGKEVVEQRLRFKAPKWLRTGSSSQKEKEKERKEKALVIGCVRPIEEDRERSRGFGKNNRLERVRLISVKGPVLDCWWRVGSPGEGACPGESLSRTLGVASAPDDLPSDPPQLYINSHHSARHHPGTTSPIMGPAETDVQSSTPKAHHAGESQHRQVPFPSLSQNNLPPIPGPGQVPAGMMVMMEEKNKVNRSSTSLVSKSSSTQRSSFSQVPQRRSSSILGLTQGNMATSLRNEGDDGMGGCKSSNSMRSRRRSRRMPSGLSILRHGGPGQRSRSLLLDLSFLLKPPDEFGNLMSRVIESVVRRLRVKCVEFVSKRLSDSTLSYFKGGGERHIISTLKNELLLPLLDEVKSDLLRHQQEEYSMNRNHGEVVTGWIREDWDRFTTLVENVMFAFLHTSLYTKGVAFHLSREDYCLDTILDNYRQRKIPLSQFEVDLPIGLQDETLLTEAVDKLNQLRQADGLNSTPSPLSPDTLQRLFAAMDTANEETVLNVLTAKTPLEAISVIKQTIDILVSVWNDVTKQVGLNPESRRLTPDDLLSLLASVIVRSGIQQQHSMIHYAKMFRLTGTLSPEVDWAFVSYQAAIAYLQSDPFSETDSRSVLSQAVSVSSTPSSPSLVAACTRRRPASFTPPTTSSTPVNILSTRSSPIGSRLSLSEHAPSRVQRSYHSSASSNPHHPFPVSQARLRTRTGLGPRVHTLMSGLTLVEPASAGSEVYDCSRSVDCLQSLSEDQNGKADRVTMSRPSLALISNLDHNTSQRPIDSGMLSAPMTERSCSAPWEVRSLGSIGEAGPELSIPGWPAEVEGAKGGRHSLKSLLWRSHQPDGGRGPTRSFHCSCSEAAIGVVRQGGSSHASSESLGGSVGLRGGAASPVLSRRKTVDLTFLSSPRGGVSTEVNSDTASWQGCLGVSRSLREEDTMSVQCDSIADPTSSCCSQSTPGRTTGGHQEVEGPRKTAGSLALSRSMTASSTLKSTAAITGVGVVGHHRSDLLSSSASSSQSPHLPDSWLEWGRKRLTSVTSLNLAGGSTPLTSRLSSSPHRTTTSGQHTRDSIDGPSVFGTASAGSSSLKSSTAGVGGFHSRSSSMSVTALPQGAGIITTTAPVISPAIEALSQVRLLQAKRSSGVPSHFTLPLQQAGGGGRASAEIKTEEKSREERDQGGEASRRVTGGIGRRRGRSVGTGAVAVGAGVVRSN